MKCDKCGFKTNPGDQICIQCGNKLSFKNLEEPKVEIKEEIKKSKFEWKTIILFFIILVICFIVFLILNYFLRKAL